MFKEILVGRKQYRCSVSGDKEVELRQKRL